MKLNRNEKTGDTSYEMEILLEPGEFKEAVSKVYRKEAKKYNVPGFRKGHAPRNLIEKMYGQDVFYYDAVNDLFPAAYEEALQETGIDPIDSPEVEAESIDTEKGAVLSVKVTIKPELEVKKYEGLEAERLTKDVEQEQIDAEIGRLQERNSRLIKREGPAEEGDIADIDYEGKVDGVPFDGGKDENFKLTLGSHQFIEGFEEQVVGHKEGEEFDIEVTFPENYHAENLAGKPAVFSVKINEVQQKELPELDDEFAKDVSEFDTLKELTEDIRKNLQQGLDADADQELENRLAEALVETLEGDIPEIMFEKRVDEMVQDFGFRLQQQGLNLDTYFQFSGTNSEEFRKGFREQAEKLVKMRLALEAVARYKELEVAQEDIDAEIKRISEKYQMPEEDVRKLMPESEIKKDLLVTKAMEYVKDKAKITEKKAEKEPPQKDEEKTEKEDKKPKDKEEKKEPEKEDKKEG
ncbi:trigger factor [Ruminococcaceae bacterium OttesenSCG-928-I18]|nr:trigger factor [Ruminococcaceae bacterium OttesenSCG-928-I18]